MSPSPKEEAGMSPSHKEEAGMSPSPKEEAGIDPYGVLFPLGALTAILGVLLWVAFQSSWVSFFPRQAHGHLMFFGFLWAFISGFLMTAIPKMTQTPLANMLEIFAVVFCVLLQWVLNLRNMDSASVGLFSLQVFVLIIFVGRRFVASRRVPFEGFVFVPFAMICGLSGTLAYFLASRFSSAFLFLLSGEAVLLNLICGLGSRLIPVLSRTPGALMPDAEGRRTRFIGMGIAAVCLNFTFFLEVYGAARAAYLLRAIFVSFIAIRYFKVFVKPMARTFIGWGLKGAIFCLILGYGLLAVFPEGSSLPYMHLVYIGGFSLVTLMVATRVTLAHGGYSLDWELKSKLTLFVIATLIVAAAIRGFVVGSDLSTSGLSWAALLFALGIGTWLLSWWRRATASQGNLQ
jgi:uncharacterized protein involved in response to NO